MKGGRYRERHRLEDTKRKTPRGRHQDENTKMKTGGEDIERVGAMEEIETRGELKMRKSRKDGALTERPPWNVLVTFRPAWNVY
jgi:hypothetical protein